MELQAQYISTAIIKAIEPQYIFTALQESIQFYKDKLTITHDELYFEQQQVYVALESPTLLSLDGC